MTLKKIEGFVTNYLGLSKANVVVRCSSDRSGETLSLESNGIMITVDFEEIEAVMNKERKRGSK